MTKKYNQPQYCSKEETLTIMNGVGTVEQKVNAIVGAIHSINDCDWLQALCLENIDHQDKWITGAAINGLGNIARIFRRIDKDLVLSKLRTLKLSRKELSGKIDDAVDDIMKFIV